MGVKTGLGDVAARVGQSRGFDTTMRYGAILSKGEDDTNVAVNTFASTLKNSLSSLSAYINNVSTSKSYLDVVAAHAEVILNELGEMKQLALQSQNASATDRLALQSSFATKQRNIASKLVDAEFGGISIFTNSTTNNSIIAGNGLDISADIDGARGYSLINTASIMPGTTNSLQYRNFGTNITDVDVELRIYGDATLQLANPGVISASDTVWLSAGTAAVLNFYTSGGPSVPTKGTVMAIGSTSGIGLGENFVFATLNSVVVDFFGSQEISTFVGGSTAINGGVFKIRMTGQTVPAASGIRFANICTANAPQVGAIGIINLGDSSIAAGTACTIDTMDNAVIATNVINAAMDQVSTVLGKIDNKLSALAGIASVQTGIQEAMGSAIAELTAADITKCMSEIVAAQSSIQYITSVWSCQNNLTQLALKAFQQAVTSGSNPSN